MANLSLAQANYLRNELEKEVMEALAFANSRIMAEIDDILASQLKDVDKDNYLNLPW